MDIAGLYMRQPASYVKIPSFQRNIVRKPFRNLLGEWERLVLKYHSIKCKDFVNSKIDRKDIFFIKNWTSLYCVSRDTTKNLPGQLYRQYKGNLTALLGADPQISPIEKFALLWYICYTTNPLIESIQNIGKLIELTPEALRIFLPEKLWKSPLWCQYIFLITGIYYKPSENFHHFKTLTPEAASTLFDFSTTHSYVDIASIYSSRICTCC